MNKQDLQILLTIVDLAAQKGLIALSAFREVGTTVDKVKAAINAMGEGNVLVIYAPPDNSAPSESAAPVGTELELEN